VLSWRTRKEKKSKKREKKKGAAGTNLPGGFDVFTVGRRHFSDRKCDQQTATQVIFFFFG
jgi:hypothetical protein